MSDVMAEVVRLLTEVVGDDLLLEGEVGPETTFGDGLALESIEFVALVDRLRERYGGVDFPSFVAALDVDRIVNLTVGDIVDHIEAELREDVHA
ncbi:acyl carrier protein [Actinomadura rubrisoli]|uniref:Acyl carrier protein n=1 Tax=Actinomadura rubrisoli TaxID=2530368 RepID=A0A4R5A212_9ACTN|nr:acyl carrier protein [Actinomadura rubrisoli]TDD64990.1 acyl carrier protein [Actinomadura rubrisoli]